MESWTINDALEYYLVDEWGSPFVSINKLGHVEIAPLGSKGGTIDLKELVDNLVTRGLSLPILVRFNDILHSRIEQLNQAFKYAATEYGFEGDYRLCMPVKVNHQRHVVEQVLQSGCDQHVGLEAGSKPELFMALALADDPDALIVCNGYKDREYIEAALMAQKIGRQVLLVVDRFLGIHKIVDIAKRLGIKPRIGLRVKLSTKGSGKWIESAGDRSKFGLSASEILQAVEFLDEQGLIDCIELLHFHLGSQINNIAVIKAGLRESCRFFVDLWSMGIKPRYIDVGGGLAVDYDGSRTNFQSSKNYSVQEYANDVVASVNDACSDAGIPPPTILSESGRFIAAHHAVLVFDVLGVNSRGMGDAPRKPVESDHNIHHLLWEAYEAVNRKTYQEAYNDLLEYRQDALTLHNHGILDLRARAYAEELSWACAQKIRCVIQELDYVPDVFRGLEKYVSDTYYCNFSVFQSVPDHWAVKQLFPVMPIHRLNQKPTRPATIADLTCDSDGKIDRFIDLHDVRDTIRLHPVGDSPYILGVFLVGAYQEVLGDLHNLFGDTHAVHISLHDDGYALSSLVKGDTVSDVLGYMQYDKEKLGEKLREVAESALRKKLIDVQDVRKLMKIFEEGLNGYTYLEED